MKFLLAWVLLFGIQLLYCYGCIHEEKEAMLKLKHSLLASNISPPLSWQKDDCCEWEKVKCNNITRRVSELGLGEFYWDYGGFGRSEGWNLELGIFSSFVDLQHLDLSYNNIGGSLEVFSSLVKIEELWLRENELNGTAQFMCNIPSLQHLDVSSNLLTGPIPHNCFANATSLEYLDLSNNDFDGNFSFLSFGNNSRLTYILLGGNRELEIQFNHKGWAPHFLLDSFEISACKVEERSELRKFLSSQYQLTKIYLSHVPLVDAQNWVFENNTKLMAVHLGNSSLVGNYDLPKYQRTNLYNIDLSDNALEGSMPTSLHYAFPNIMYLNLSYNSFSGEIPSSLCNMSFLFFLDLSNNNLYGEMPSCLLTDSVSLDVLKLSNNKLTGNLIIGKPELSLLRVLHLDGNMLTGHLLESLGDMKMLSVVNLRGNSFHGNIPNTLCNMTYLVFLELANNSFGGLLPNCSMPNQLRFLSIATNNFTGPMLTNFFNNSVIEALDASDNQFSGRINWICDLKQIKLLLLSRNKFKGSLDMSCELPNLRMLDLSHNSLFGNIPSYLGNISIRRLRINDYWWSDEGIIDLYGDPQSYFVDEVQFTTKGNYYPYHGYLIGLMIGFDLSDNNFSGEIPSDLGNLTTMKSLNLSYNQLTGRIPQTLSNMIDIESLDLSHNKLSGPIPNEVIELKSLEVFSVSYNNLSGCLPDLKDQFLTFNISSYIGNPDLHGPPLDNECNSSKALPNYEKAHKDSDIFDDVILYAIIVGSFVFGFWMCIGFLFWSQRGRYIRARYIDSYVDSFSLNS